MLAPILLIPLVAAALLALIPAARLASWLNVAASLATAAAAARAIAAPPPADALLHLDGLSSLFLGLGAFVGATTSLFSARYIVAEQAQGRLGAGALRFYHAMFQLVTFGMNLALLANNIGLMWVALELATLVTVLVVGVYRTPSSLEAAWKYFILGSVGIALALFGTILVYLAGRAALAEGDAMVWTALVAAAARLDPALLNLAFVFLLLGYGTKIGLVPLHAWLPDAHAEGPTPISAVLGGLLLNVALYALLRIKMIVGANPAAMPPGPFLVTIGLATILFAALMLYRRRDIKRLFSYSSIEHMGVIIFALGLGGAAASGAALLQAIMHSLTKSAIFFAVGHACQIKASQRIEDITGLTVSHPFLGWSLVAGTVAIVGLPPSGLFMSEFQLLAATAPRAPWLAVLAGLGLLAALAALLWRLGTVAFGAPHGENQPVRVAALPILLHLLLVFAAGIWLPPAFAAWLHAVATTLG